jgi:large proline-rich protein BAG6
MNRFLPCNSHHIRDNSSQQQQQQQQNQQTQTIHIRPQRRTVSLDRNSMRGVRAASNVSQSASNSVPPVATGSVVTTSRHFSGVTNITDEELNHRFSLFGIQFSLRDLDSIEPSFYNLQRDSLRAFLIENYFSNNEINDETVSKAIHDIIIELEKYLDRLSQFQHPDYDIRKSIENLIVKSLPFIINLICDDKSGEFGVRIERQLITFCENVYMILVKCIGVRETEKFLNDIANIVMTGEVSRGKLSKFPAHIIQTFLIERRSYDLSEVQEFLIIKRPQAPAVSLHLFFSFINLLIKFICKQPIATNEEFTPMDVDEDVTEELVMENEDSSSSNNIQSEDLLSDPLPVIDRSEPWHAQFPSSWLPIITRDIARQRQKVNCIIYTDVLHFHAIDR